MGIWGKIICGGIGAMLGGPLGALAGAGIGHVMFDRNSEIFTSQEKAESAFVICFFGCLSKMMKADGTVSKEETECLKQMIQEEFKFNVADINALLDIINRAGSDPQPASAYINQLASLVNFDSDIGMTLIIALHRLAMADNFLHPAEKEILYYAERAFRLERGTVDRMFVSVRRESFGNIDSAYKVLGCTPDMSDSEIKKVYRKKCLEFHPDRLTGKGLPEEFIKFSSDKMVKIQDAYEAVKKARQ